MERLVLATLARRGRLTTPALAAAYYAQFSDSLPSRSFMSSLNRALRKLEDAKLVERLRRDGPHGWALKHDDRAATAYHEAGHAVIAHALALGRPVKLVTIKPTPKATGHVAHHGKSRRLADISKAELRKEALSLFAGAAAEKRFFRTLPRWRRDTVHQGARHDNKQIYNAVGAIMGLGPFHLSFFEGYREERAALRTKATKLVEKHWPAIERVADYLIDYETLRGEHLDEIISRRA
jgi:hypothetical protein